MLFGRSIADVRFKKISRIAISVVHNIHVVEVKIMVWTMTSTKRGKKADLQLQVIVGMNLLVMSVFDSHQD